MSVVQLVQYLLQGREIEFSFHARSFFLSSDWGTEQKQGEYYIYDNLTRSYVVVGSVDEILSYEFQPGVSLKERIEQFDFESVL